jgi:phosphatidylserine/phosphatidylglycerophosphate/cardiolipin synthase-like enzyme
MVIDDDQCPLDPSGVRMCALARLAASPRVTIVDDGRSRYMHHKFVIAEGRVVWLGSANFTRVSYCGELNDGLVVDDAAIVAAYGDEFVRLFRDRAFGPRPRTAPVRSGDYTVYFGPESPVTAPSQWFEALVSAVDTASTSIAVMTYAWTRTELSDALIRAAARGVEVRALVPANYHDEPPAQALVTAGIPVRVARVHYKVLLVDDHRVATGSPNWSENAWTNNEASLWIDSATVGAAYRAHFEATYSRALAP